MINIQKLDPNQLRSLSFEDYFKRFESELRSEVDLDTLTAIFTDKPFTDKKPYLYRRQIAPIDNRFTNIEIVFDEKKKVRVIVWEFEVLLSDLIKWFGPPIMHYHPIAEVTMFVFKSSNPDIDIMESFYPEDLTQNGELEFVKNSGDRNGIIIDPVFGFFQIKLV